MHLKRFRSQTADQALEIARRELGADAIILGTRTVPRPGWRGIFGACDVIVTAAAERVVSEDRPGRQELRHPLRPGMSAVRAQLCAAGLDAAVVDEVAAGLGNELRAATPEIVRQALTTWAASVTVAEAADAEIEVFVGPGGGGKTTAVSQIATARAEKGQRPVLVSTDASKLGAVEPLRLHAEVLGVRFVAARSMSQLELALADWRRPLLVDTVGGASMNSSTREMLSLIATTPGARFHLVVSADTTAAALDRLIATYRLAAPLCVVVTKIEDGESIAPLAGTLRSRGLRVSYLATGSQEPRDLHYATPALVAAALVGDSLAASEHAA
jgi:flagellar biosynthesis protein FlhF